MTHIFINYVMVQLFYYENRGQSARKLLRHEGCKNKVHLFPYEGWARPASLCYWVLKTSWWSRTRCKIVQVCGVKRNTTIGRMTTAANGNVTVMGKFKGGQEQDPDFRLTLNTNVSSSDFQIGYSMTGMLERGCRKEGRMEMTHYAMIKRKGY